MWLDAADRWRWLAPPFLEILMEMWCSGSDDSASSCSFICFYTTILEENLIRFELHFFSRYSIISLDLHIIYMSFPAPRFPPFALLLVQSEASIGVTWLFTRKLFSTAGYDFYRMKTWWNYLSKFSIPCSCNENGKNSWTAANNHWTKILFFKL